MDPKGHRKDERLSVEASGEWALHGGTSFNPCVLVDVSAGGARLQTDEAVPSLAQLRWPGSGEKLDVRFNGGDTGLRFELTGEVLESDGAAYGSGFCRLLWLTTKAQRRKLAKRLSRHKRRLLEKALMASYQQAADYRLLKHRTVSLTDRIWLLLEILKYQFHAHYFGRPPKWRLYLRRLGGKRVLPNFVMTGPIKSGSSDLAVRLMSYHGVLAPLSKEVLAPDITSWRIHYPTEAQYSRCEKEYGVARVGMMAPFFQWYSLMKSIHREVPTAKVILTLRDPVDRAYYHWKWDYFLA